VQGIWACVLCLSGKYGDLLDYVIFAVLVFYVLTIIGIFRLRITRPNAERPYKAFGYPVLPSSMCCSPRECAWIFSSTSRAIPGRA